MLYFQNVKAVHDQALALGGNGAKIGLAELKDKLSGHSDDASKKQLDTQAEQQSHDFNVKVCQDQADIKAVQDQLATQFPAFKPYGGIMSDKSIADCRKDLND